MKVTVKLNNKEIKEYRIGIFNDIKEHVESIEICLIEDTPGGIRRRIESYRKELIESIEITGF